MFTANSSASTERTTNKIRFLDPWGADGRGSQDSVSIGPTTLLGHQQISVDMGCAKTLCASTR